MRYVSSGMRTPSTGYRILTYGTFLGLDLASAPQEVSEARSPDMLNMYIDNGVPKKRPGWALLRDFGGAVLGLHRMPGILFVHCGTKLIAYPLTDEAVTVPEYEEKTYDVGDCCTYSDAVYRCVEKIETAEAWTAAHWQADDTAGLVYAGMSSTQRSASFYMNGCLYLLDGKRYSRIEKSGTLYTASPVSANAHIPITGVSGYWDASVTPAQWTACVPNEEKNLLTPVQTNTMAGDAVHTEFWLTERGAATTVKKVELLNGSTMVWEETTAYTASEDNTKKRTKITFTTAPEMHPKGAGVDNIRVTFYREDDENNAELINACTLAAAFGYFNDNRVFLSGNPDYPNRDWASGIDDPTYIEENGWANIGSDAAAIIGYLHYGDVLAIMKEDNNTDAEIYIRSGQQKEDGSILFPVQQGVKGVGAVSKTAFANLRDDALFLAKEGVYAIVGTDASQQNTVQNRSKLVDTALYAEPGKSGAAAVVWLDRLLLCFPETGHVYVADARLKTGAGDNESFGYEWVKWDNIRASFFQNEDGTLYFATADGKLCVFSDGYTDNGAPIDAYWCTKAQDFGAPGKYKTLLKRGTHMIAGTGGRLKLSALTEDGETVLFDAATEAQGVRTVSAQKVVPKFRTVRMKVENGTAGEGLELEGISLLYTFAHWVK